MTEVIRCCLIMRIGLTPVQWITDVCRWCVCYPWRSSNIFQSVNGWLVLSRLTVDSWITRRQLPDEVVYTILVVENSLKNLSPVAQRFRIYTDSREKMISYLRTLFIPTHAKKWFLTCNNFESKNNSILEKGRTYNETFASRRFLSFITQVHD